MVLCVVEHRLKRRVVPSPSPQLSLEAPLELLPPLVTFAEVEDADDPGPDEERGDSA